MTDINKKYFCEAWNKGYRDENIGLRGVDPDTIYRECIFPFASTTKQALEIGCGGGYWTRLMYKNFPNLTVVDVLPYEKNSNFHEYVIDFDKTKYIELESMDYSLSMIEDKSIDFLFSFDVFCHFSYSAKKKYLSSIKRVLRGNAVISFANWPRSVKDSLSDLTNKELLNKEKYMEENFHGWFYDDLEVTKELLSDFNIVSLDLFPNFRDTIAQVDQR